MTQLTRRYHFSASHRLHSKTLSDERNAELFGKCNNPFGHGHNYSLSVTVAGNVDPNTGLLLDLAGLDRLLERHVLPIFSHRNLNLDVPQFADLIPTTENVALVLSAILEGLWGGWFGHDNLQLSKIQVQETDRNGFEVDLSTARGQLHLMPENERVTVHV